MLRRSDVREQHSESAAQTHHPPRGEARALILLELRSGLLVELVEGGAENIKKATKNDMQA